MALPPVAVPYQDRRTGGRLAPATERADRVRQALFGNPPLGHALLAWDGSVRAGFAGYSLIWPSSALFCRVPLPEER